MAITPTSKSTGTQLIKDAADRISEKKGFAAQQRLEANKATGALGINNQDLIESYVGYRASHPGSSLAEFAVVTAPKLDADALQIGKIIASITKEAAPTAQILGQELQNQLGAGQGSGSPGKNNSANDVTSSTNQDLGPAATVANEWGRSLPNATGKIGGTDTVAQQDPKAGKWTQSNGQKKTKTDAVFTTGGYTINYTQKDNGSNALKITDKGGKDVTPDAMKNGTNGSIALQNGAIVQVSGNGETAKIAVAAGTSASAYQFGKGGGQQLNLDASQYFKSNQTLTAAIPVYTSTDTTASDPNAADGASLGFLKTPNVYANEASSNPGLPNGSNMAYGKVDVNLFPSGDPKASDVNQHGIGDCDVDSGLASLAQNNPDIIKNGIKDNGDGTYDVSMFDPNGKGVTMKVDSQFPVDQNGQLAATGTADYKANWVTIAEKAAAKYISVYGKGGADPENKNGYDAIGGDGPEKVIPMFTGVHTTSSSAANKLSTSDMQATLQNAINNGATITAGTGDKVSYDDGQIVNSHGYAVLGTTTRNGQTMVQIRNPWGSGNDPSGSGYSKANGGVSTVPLDEFVKHFDIRIVDTNADKKSSIVGANQNGTNQASLAALLGR